MSTPLKWPGRERPSSTDLRAPASTGDLPPGRIEIADARHEDGIDAFRLTHFKIIIEGSGITRIVLARPELERIDEDADRQPRRRVIVPTSSASDGPRAGPPSLARRQAGGRRSIERAAESGVFGDAPVIFMT